MKQPLLALLSLLIMQTVTAQTIHEPAPWYHHTSIYQVYPRSFYDSNGDGIGDIQGIIQKLDYIRAMGYDAIWFSPFYNSPQRDFGYDISDYCNIAPEYGTMADTEQLIQEVHARGMKIIFDMVMNHTSDEHTWFKESASSRDNSKSDWYIWRDKPTGWKSLIGGSGWHYCEARNQYYWASFLPFQPDLNYRNPEVKEKMFEVVRFWLNKGVDGYRLDIFNSIYKDEKFRSTIAVRKEVARQGWSKEYVHSVKAWLNLPESIQFAKELRAVCDSYGDKILLGEIYGNHHLVKNYLGTEKNDGLGLVFNFEMLRFKYNASYFRKLIQNLEQSFPDPYMPVYVFSNHDRRRSMKRLRGDADKAKLLHMLQLTARGVPCMYYGEELGMTDGRIPYKKGLDPIAQKYKWVARFLTDWADETLNRDDVRTPMQWNNSVNAGFTKADSAWLPVNSDYKKVNAETALQNDSSLVNIVRQVLLLRKKSTALSHGSLELLPESDLPKGLLGFIRKASTETVLVLLNFSSKPISFTVSLAEGKTALFSINAKDSVTGPSVTLSPFGAVLLR
jgi:oligo-1,6-glucosidase/alpha-glucosidase